MASQWFSVMLLIFDLPRAILKQACTRGEFVFGTNAVALLTFGQPRAILKRARTRESSHEQRAVGPQ